MRIWDAETDSPSAAGVGGGSGAGVGGAGVGTGRAVAASKAGFAGALVEDADGGSVRAAQALIEPARARIAGSGSPVFMGA